MRVLYAIQGTGNGHASRAEALIPVFRQYVDVDVLVSGDQCDLHLPFEINYRFKGLGFYFGSKGGVDVWKTIRKTNILQFLFDVIRLDLRTYDLVVSDFEPISAWSSKLLGKPCISLSHQSSFLFKESPRPDRVNRMAELILKYYAPAPRSFGFHFKKYSHDIYYPIIRPSIREISPSDRGHIIVYLPGYGSDHLCRIFGDITSVHWKIYAKNEINTQSPFPHIDIIPAGSSTWLDDLASASGAIIGAGFEGPSELLYLGKKMLVVPMSNQYEQHCNAAAPEEMGIPVLPTLSKNKIPIITQWLDHGKAIHIPYPDEREDMVKSILTPYSSSSLVTLSQ